MLSKQDVELEKTGFQDALNRIRERVQMLFSNPVEIRDGSKYARSNYYGILYYYSLVARQPWRFFRSLAPHHPLFRVIPYFSDNPREERRKQISYVVWGNKNVLQIVEEEMQKFADDFSFEIVRTLHAPFEEEVNPIQRFLKETNDPFGIYN